MAEGMSLASHTMQSSKSYAAHILDIDAQLAYRKMVKVNAIIIQPKETSIISRKNHL